MKTVSKVVSRAILAYFVLLLLSVIPQKASADIGYVWPVPSVPIGSHLSQGYIVGEDGKIIHDGLDIYSGLNTPIVATRSGTVCRKLLDGHDIPGVYTGAGNGIVIDHHDGVYSHYAHMNSIEYGIEEGSWVEAGQVIGYMGATGGAKGIHLHFALKSQSGGGSNGAFNNNPDVINYTSYSPPISFDTYIIEKVEEYNIKAGVWLSNPTGKTLSEIGMQCGSDKNTATERTITTNVAWTRPYLAYDADIYYGNLASDRLYYIRYYVVVDGHKYYSAWMEATTKKAVITFDTYSIENLYDSDVRLSVWVDNPQGRKLTEIGIQCGKTWEQSQKYVIDGNVFWTRPNLSYYLSHFIDYLESNTRYAARYYVVSEDVFYYSDWYDIVTPEGGISFDTYGGVQEINDKDARPAVWLNNPNSRVLSEIGFEWGTSKTSTSRAIIISNVSWARSFLNYQMSPYTGLLESGTEYYCRYYVIAEEKKYSSDWFSFTTAPQEITFSTPDLVFPASITTIEESAFEGTPMAVVYIPDSCTFISSFAFRDCEFLSQIRIPAKCEIADTAFDGVEKVYIFGTAGSYAEVYCQDHANCVFVEE